MYPDTCKPRSYGVTRKKIGSGDHRAVVSTLPPPPPPRRSSPGSASPHPFCSARTPQRASPSDSGDSRHKETSGGHRHFAPSEPPHTYEKQANPKGLSEVTAMLQASTVDYTPPPPEAANFLHQQGLTPATPRQAYAMLAAQAEQATQHKTEGIVLSKLRSALNAQPEEPQSKQQRWIEIARLTRELQSK